MPGLAERYWGFLSPEMNEEAGAAYAVVGLPTTRDVSTPRNWLGDSGVAYTIKDYCISRD